MICRDLATWILPEDASQKRDFPRPIDKRQPNYEAEFDRTTIFYDVILSASNRRVIAIGPPLLNLSTPITDSDFLNESGKLDHKVFTPGRYSITTMDLPSSTHDLLIKSSLGYKRIKLSPDERKLLEGRRVLLTQSKDNDLQWITDWVNFNNKTNKADAVLIYDNGSTKYSLEDLEAKISGVSGIHATIVVEWPFKRGPEGVQNIWDSDFGQVGAIQHARYRFLQSARSVLFCDVDELPIVTGGGSVFDEVEMSKTGYICFMGRWVEGIVEKDIEWNARRHRDFCFNSRPPGFNCPNKWAVVPRICKDTDAWDIHSVLGMTESTPSNFTYYSHFRSISTSWKYERSNLVLFDPNLHHEDVVLRQALHACEF